jgi:hypothetical protein
LKVHARHVRIVSLLLNVIYLPVFWIFIHLIVPTTFSCPPSEALRFFNFSEGIARYFAIDSSYCAAYTLPFVPPDCPLVVNESQLVLAYHPHLRFNQEILADFWAVLLFILVYYVFGIPFLFFLIFRQTSKALVLIPAYGENANEKYLTLLDRLNSPAISLFDAYTFTHIYWEIYDIAFKAVVMIFESITTLVNPKVGIALPFLYCGMTIDLFIFKPFSSTQSLIFGCASYFCSAVFSILTIYATVYHNYLHPNLTGTFAAVIDIFDFVATIILYFLDQNGEEIKARDPTRIKNSSHDDNSCPQIESFSFHSLDSIEGYHIFNYLCTKGVTDIQDTFDANREALAEEFEDVF